MEQEVLLMNYRSFLGSRVSEVGMGCWAIGGNAHGNSYGSTDDTESVAAVKRAVELGCSFFDTADVYGHGHSERLLGKALKDVREDVMIATKVGGAYMYGRGGMDFSPDYIRFALSKSLERLRTDYVDVYQLHNPPLAEIRKGEIFMVLRELQSEGKIRHAGVSVHTLDEGVAALRHVDSVQCVFNALDPRNYELMEAAKMKRVAIIVREPLANGFLTGKYSADSEFEEGDIRSRMPDQYVENITEIVEDMKEKFAGRESLAQVALKYVLTYDCVSTVIPGAKTPQQVEENMHASDIEPLTKGELRVFGG